MKRTHYQMKMPEYEPMEEELTIATGGLAAISGNIAELYPNLKILNLRSNNLGDESVPDLINLMNRLPKLLKLDLTDNPLSANAIRELNNAVTARNIQIQNYEEWLCLLTDYTLWSRLNDNLPVSLWALSHEQWPKQKIIEGLFESISIHMFDSQELAAKYLYTLGITIELPNKNGWTPLIGALQVTSQIIPKTLIQCYGLEWFHKQMMKQASPNVLQVLNNKIPNILKNYLGWLPSQATLAREFVDTYLPDESPRRSECLGMIAFYQQDYKQSYEHCIKAIGHDLPFAQFYLARMRHLNLLPKELPFDLPTVIAEYTKAALNGHFVSLIQLMGIYEYNNDLMRAFDFYNQIQAQIHANPELEHNLIEANVAYINSFTYFESEISDMLSTLFLKRVELTHQRYLKSNLNLVNFNQTTLLKALESRFGNLAMIAIVRTLGKSLFASWHQDNKIFNKIAEKLCRIMGNIDRPNHDLLSMDPAAFVQSLLSHLEEYQRENMHLQSGGVVIKMM